MEPVGCSETLEVTNMKHEIRQKKKVWKKKEKKRNRGVTEHRRQADPIGIRLRLLDLENGTGRFRNVGSYQYETWNKAKEKSMKEKEKKRNRGVTEHRRQADPIGIRFRLLDLENGTGRFRNVGNYQYALRNIPEERRFIYTAAEAWSHGRNNFLTK